MSFATRPDRQAEFSEPFGAISLRFATSGHQIAAPIRYILKRCVIGGTLPLPFSNLYFEVFAWHVKSTVSWSLSEVAIRFPSSTK